MSNPYNKSSWRHKVVGKIIDLNQRNGTSLKDIEKHWKKSEARFIASALKTAVKDNVLTKTRTKYLMNVSHHANQGSKAKAKVKAAKKKTKKPATKNKTEKLLAAPAPQEVLKTVGGGRVFSIFESQESQRCYFGDRTNYLTMAGTPTVNYLVHSTHGKHGGYFPHLTLRSACGVKPTVKFQITIPSRLLFDSTQRHSFSDDYIFSSRESSAEVIDFFTRKSKFRLSERNGKAEGKSLVMAGALSISWSDACSGKQQISFQLTPKGGKMPVVTIKATTQPSEAGEKKLVGRLGRFDGDYNRIRYAASVIVRLDGTQEQCRYFIQVVAEKLTGGSQR